MLISGSFGDPRVEGTCGLQGRLLEAAMLYTLRLCPVFRQMGQGQTDRETSVWSPPSPPRHRSSRGAVMLPLNMAQGWRRGHGGHKDCSEDQFCSPVGGGHDQGSRVGRRRTSLLWASLLQEMPSSKPGCPLSALALKEPTRTQTLMCGADGETSN